MPDGGWLILGLAAVGAVALVCYLIVKGHLDENRVAKTLSESAKKISDYLAEKRQHEAEAEKEKSKIPEIKPATPDNVVDFHKRTQEKWPPD